MKIARVHSRMLLCATVVAALLQGACSTETTESENIATPAIFARMDVDARSTGSSKVTVELNVGGSNGTNISLTANERLEVTHDGVTKIMNRDTDLFDVDYEIGFDDYDTTSPFAVSFFRSTGEIISGSSIFLPAAFDIGGPVSGMTFSVADSLPISWTPASGGSADLTITTRCTMMDGATRLSSSSFSISDDGLEIFALSRLPAATDTSLDRNINCEFSLAIQRDSTGSIDPAFEGGGSFRGRQVRTVEDMFLVL